jgi:Fe-S cluster biogenesis protein NfuA
VEERVRQVLDQLRPQLASHGGELELVTVEDAVARVRLSGGGCGHSAGSAELEQVVADSILALAPELGSVESIHDEDGPQALIPVDALFRRPATAGRSG